jgi:hypothetical protein
MKALGWHVPPACNTAEVCGDLTLQLTGWHVALAVSLQHAVPAFDQAFVEYWSNSGCVGDILSSHKLHRPHRREGRKQLGS